MLKQSFSRVLNLLAFYHFHFYTRYTRLPRRKINGETSSVIIYLTLSINSYNEKIPCLESKRAENSS